METLNTITILQISNYYQKIRIWLLSTKQYHIYDAFKEKNRALSFYKTKEQKSIQLNKIINHCYDTIGECI